MSKNKSLSSPWKAVFVCAVLTTLTWLTFAKTLGFEFTNCDDQVYVSENPDVIAGLTGHGLVWAFTQTVSGNWHPLTIISHMLDCTLYGLNPSGHHFTNVFLHTLVGLLVFLVLSNMSRTFWQSAFVAAVFAIHPLRVESVAWISERKDVLSGFFFILTLAAYTQYVRAPAFRRYALVLILFALGLMAKPMLVTVPFVLLLLDYWPLGRFTRSTPIDLRSKGKRQRATAANVWTLVLEKVPLIVLSGASCIATILAQRTGIVPADRFSMLDRLGNAFISVVTYIRQMLWPSGLAVLYPFSTAAIPTWQIILSVAVVLIITAGAFILRKDRPYVFVGWFWFLGMLVPVSGIIQVGLQAHADRYTYLPQIGLYILIAWGLADLLASWRHRRTIFATASIIVLAALTASASVQTSYWHDSIRLWTRALAVTSRNSAAEDAICSAFLHAGQLDEAAAHARKEVAMQPNSPQAHTSLGTTLLLKRQPDEALDHFQQAVRLNPQYAEAQLGLGSALLRKGETAEAVTHYQQAVGLDPGSATKHYDLALALLMEGRAAEAADHLRVALNIQPAYPDADYFLGIISIQQEHVQDAITHWQRALKFQPRNWNAASMLAWVLATYRDDSVRDGARAVQLAETAVRASSSQDPTVFRALAAAYAEIGRFSAAVDAAQQGLHLANVQGNSVLVGKLEREISLYQTNTPVREN